MQLNKRRYPTVPRRKEVEQYIKRESELKTEPRDRDSIVLKDTKPTGMPKADVGAFVKNAIDWLLGYETTRFKQFLKANGLQKIEKIAAGRVPIEKAVRLGFDLLSGGAFEQAHKKLGVDNFFHLYLFTPNLNNSTGSFSPMPAFLLHIDICSSGVFTPSRSGSSNPLTPPAFMITPYFFASNSEGELIFSG